MKAVKIFLLTLVAAFAAISCSQNVTSPNNASSANTNKSAASPTASPGILDSGLAAAELYKTNCAECHKPDGKGGKVTVDGKTMEPDDLTSAKMAAKSDEKLTEYIREGFPDDGMPAFKDKLNADQIKAIVAHLRRLQKG